MSVSKRLILALLVLIGGCGTAMAAQPPKYAFRPTDARVELTIKGTEFTVGQPIPYEMKVTNLSKNPLSYMTSGTSTLVPGYSVQVLDASGKQAPRPRKLLTGGSILGSTTIQAGASVTHKGYVNQWAVLAQGKYTVTASWAPFPFANTASRPRATSEPVAVDVVKPNDAERDKLLADARRQLQDASSLEDKQQAIWALAYTLDVRAIPDLVQAGRDINVSQEVESALMRFPNPTEIEDELLKELQSSGPTEPLAYALSHYRVAAVKTLPLLKSWLGKGDARQRAAVLLALSMIDERYGDAWLRELILKQLKDREPGVRHHAVLAIGNGGFGDTLETVTELAKDEPDVWVREQAIVAVGWHRDDRAIPMLKQLAGDGNAAVSRAAIGALKYIGSPAANAALAEHTGTKQNGQP